jgi:hypothetical protein
MWVDMLKLRNKTLNISFNNFVTQYEARLKTEAENTIYKNENIQIMK